MSSPISKHRLVVVNPGHFHAALSLREAHPGLDDEVRVYAEDGPDLAAFLALVESFNARGQRPTRWRLAVHRGPDWLERAVAERAGDLAVLAGKSDAKMAAARRLLDAGFHVFCDKPVLIEDAGLALLRDCPAGPPLCMEMMTGRRVPGNRLLRALVDEVELFGGFAAGAGPALRLSTTHHLAKLVNGKPLVRPAWYFDHGLAGEGMLDVTTHLVDAVQQLVGGGRTPTLLSARQWPTEVPRAVFRRITGLDDFPAALRDRVAGDSLGYLGNAALSFRIDDIEASLESLWGLEEPPGGGDFHRTEVEGARARLVAEIGPATGFESRVTVAPRAADPGFAAALAAAVARLQPAFPGVTAEPDGAAWRLLLPPALRTGHEQHFAEFLNEFLACIAAGALPPAERADMLAKYRLLLEARALSRRSE